MINHRARLTPVWRRRMRSFQLPLSVVHSAKDVTVELLIQGGKVEDWSNLLPDAFEESILGKLEIPPQTKNR